VGKFKNPFLVPVSFFLQEYRYRYLYYTEVPVPTYFLLFQWRKKIKLNIVRELSRKDSGFDTSGLTPEEIIKVIIPLPLVTGNCKFFTPYPDEHGLCF
jgi:hypothetical protein